MGINDLGGLLGSGVVGGQWNPYAERQQQSSLWYSGSCTTATANTITIGAWDADASDEPDEPAPSTPMAWLDRRITEVADKGRQLLEAA